MNGEGFKYGKNLHLSLSEMIKIQSYGELTQMITSYLIIMRLKNS